VKSSACAQSIMMRSSLALSAAGPGGPEGELRTDKSARRPAAGSDICRTAIALLF